MADDTEPVGLQLRVLGPIECHGEAGVLALGGPKQRCVLAVLAASTRPVRTGTLIEALYGLDAEPGARRTIATYMWNLRQVVGDVILREGDGYVLAPSVQVDGRRFEALLDTGRHHLQDDPERASATLREALALWRGHAYQDIEAHLVIEAEIARLHELRIEALEARVDADLRLGLHRELIPELEALAAEHPFRESFRASHMLALYRCGRQRDALRAFADTRHMLVEELGAEPSPVLVDLELQTTVQASRMVAVLHGAPVMVAFHPDGETVLVADANRRSEVILVDIESGQEVGRFDAGETVGDIAVSPDRSTIAVTYWDRSMMLDRAGSIPAGRLFDSSTYEERAVLDGSCCVWNPEFNTDGSLLAASGATRFAVGGAADAGGRYTQRVWELPTGSTVWSGTDPLALLGWFDADTVVVERVYLGAVTGERTAEIGLVDVDGGEPVFVDLGGTQLTSIDVGRDVIAATRNDGTVDVWSRDLAEPFASFQSAGGQVVVSHDERQLIVLGVDGEIEVIDLASGRRSQLGRHASALLAGESGGQAATPTTRVPVAERNALVETLARAGGGDLFAISVGDGSTVVWDLSLDGPNVLGNHDPGGMVVSGASSAGGDHIALLIDGPNGVSGRVVDLSTGETRVSSSAAAHGVLAAAGGAFAFGDGRTPPAGVEFLADGSTLTLTECDRPVAIDDPGGWLLVGGGFCPDMGGRLIHLATGEEVGAWPQSEWIDSAAFGRHGAAECRRFLDYADSARKRV